MNEFTPLTAADITEEIVEAAYEIGEGWYQNVRIDWEELLYRLEGMELKDGSTLYLPDQMDAGSIREIQKRVRALRRA